MWARIDNGCVAELVDVDPEGRFHPDLQWTVAPARTRVGDTYNGSAFARPPAPAAARWDVPKLKAIDRIIAAGKGAALLAALASDPMKKLRFDAAVVISSDDADARALITTIGADPDQVLAR